jgi:mono/diheme cytochrome c family protein
MMKRCCLGLGVVFISLTGLNLGAPALQQTTPPTQSNVDFERDVLPILQRSCLECHGPDKQRGRLRIDSRAALVKGGGSGPALVPGKAEASELFRRVNLPKGSEDVMPALGAPLTKAQIEVIRGWINQGAIWPDNVRPKKHWAYVKPGRPSLPKVRSAWPRSPIDYFVLARLEKEGLQPALEADRATLMRRVSLDLIGLPPSPKEVTAFLADKSADAYEKLVDRLLQSPQFGERWARPWLDLARYADSHGFQKDDFRNSFAYRDWVIKSLNEDMPFDQFTIEQLAGDLLPKATLAQKIATGFHRCAPTNVEAGSEPEETRVNQVFDRVNTTAAVWLGSTLECAQCHDHKYDPFSQKEYYQLFSFFNNTAIEAERSDPKVPGSIQFVGPYLMLDGRPSVAPPVIVNQKKLEKQLEARRQKLLADLESWEKELRASLDKFSRIHTLEIADFHSAGGAPHKESADRSILLVDDPIEKDTYTVVAHTSLRGITAFQLEALTHPSLPGQGPGRGDVDRPNFVLNTFAVKAIEKGSKDQAQPIKLTKARASFSQKNFDVAKAIDADPKSAWAIGPQFHKPHWAIFETQEPLGFAGGTTLTFTMVQNFGTARTIGRLRLSAIVGDPARQAIPADVSAVLDKPKTERLAAENKRLLDFRLEHDDVARQLKAQIEQLSAGPNAGKAVTTLVMQEMSKARPSSLFVRGDYQSPGEKVQPAAPTVLHKLPDGPPNRLTLARWLVDRDNPLVARVTVNRWWAELFGHGLVSTVEDFGIKGEPPSHPELLDWLAVEFMDKGWSMKKLLKTIVLSSTYRQSSRMTPLLRAKDDQNRLYARGPRFRMDAEMIRDNALAAAGLLSLKQFGPPIRPFQPDGLWNRIGGTRVEYVMSSDDERHRRGIYVVWKRSVPYPSFVNFDATARYACTVKRSRSNTPLQALTLLNDPVYVEAALNLAKRMVTERPGAGIDERIRHGFQACLIRAPSPAEVDILRKLYDAQLDATRQNPKAAKDLCADFPRPRDVALEEFAACYAVATALLNLDEMITKN